MIESLDGVIFFLRGLRFDSREYIQFTLILLKTDFRVVLFHYVVLCGYRLFNVSTESLEWLPGPFHSNKP